MANGGEVSVASLSRGEFILLVIFVPAGEQVASAGLEIRLDVRLLNRTIYVSEGCLRLESC